MNDRFQHAVFGTLLVLLLAGCAEPKPVEALDEAYRYGEQYQWNQAYPIIKAYLNAYPNDPGAHFLYGQYHLHRKTPYFFIAEGEFDTALYLLEQQGDVGGLHRLLSRNELEGAAHRELALLYMRLSREGLGNGVTQQVVTDWLQKSLEHVEQGLVLDPEHKFLIEMQESLTSMLKETAVTISPQAVI